MTHRDHLKRLDPEAYRGQAVVHWTMAILDRRTGWLDGRFFYRFRELLTHSLFRYSIACPVFCLMPDHLHLLWMGINESSDQKLAMRHFRQRLNESMKRIDFELQDQPYEHVLQDNEKTEVALIATCDYIARNPERAGIIPHEGYATYPFTGCLIPGYPELRPFDADFWTRLSRIMSHFRKHGTIRT